MTGRQLSEPPKVAERPEPLDEAVVQPAVRPAAPISRCEAVVSQIRRGVLSGVLRPGERLIEVSLAATLQVSRATVREALVRLVQEGLVVADPQRGLRVADFDPDSARDLAVTRLSLDRLAVSRILLDESGGRQAALVQMWRVFERHLLSPDPVARHEAHLAFHRGVWRAAANTVLNQLWPVVEAQMTIALAHDQAAWPDPERSHRMHAALMEAIATRDPEIIEAALVAHIIAPADELLDLREPGPPRAARRNEGKST